jgi:RNA polymerase sigma factor (sigma-70 family)
MNFDEKLFQRIALPRVKKYYDSHRDLFLARAMDIKDLLQECRIKLWEEMSKFKELSEDDVLKLINKILTNQLIDEKRAGFKHMKKEPVIVEDKFNKEKIVTGHLPQFVDIDSVGDMLVVTDEEERIRNKALVEVMKSKLSEKERELIEDLFTKGMTEKELACEKINKDCKGSCSLYNNLDEHRSQYGNVITSSYQKSCSKYKELSNLSKQINRLKRNILEKMKK